MENQLFELQMPDYRKAEELLLEALHMHEVPAGESVIMCFMRALVDVAEKQFYPNMM